MFKSGGFRLYKIDQSAILALLLVLQTNYYDLSEFAYESDDRLFM